MMSDIQRYDQKTILFHWLTAGAIVIMWVLGQTFSMLPRDLRPWFRSVHILLGVALLVIMVLRVRWKFTGARRLPPAESGLLGSLAVGMHHLLYLMVFLTLAVGLFLESLRGDLILGFIQFSPIIDNARDLSRAMYGRHGLVADGLVILAGLHACVAIWHRFVRKDGVLGRMLGG